MCKIIKIQRKIFVLVLSKDREMKYKRKVILEERYVKEGKSIFSRLVPRIG